MFTELGGRDPSGLNESLSRIGFRRSQMVAYRPACDHCSACVSVRILAQVFKPTPTMRKLERRNAHLVREACEPWATDEQYELLRRYLAARHPEGGMSSMDVGDYVDMIERSPVATMVYEYRLPGEDAQRGRLVGVCLTDHFGDGLSMVYSFFDPDLPALSLGTYIIIDHVRLCAAMRLPHVYLGYWIAGSRAMDYKRRFAPMEMLTGEGWTNFRDAGC